jgi:polyisoprenoid-binding protein YceI
MAFVMESVSPLSAKPITYSMGDINGEKQIIFESKAPTEYIEGVAEGVAGVVTLDTTKPGLDLKATLSVPVASMQTGIVQRDEHLRSSEWLDADRYPIIRFDLSPLGRKNVVKKGDNVWFVNTVGSFSLKGVSRKISVPVTLKKERSGDVDKLFISGRFSLKLADYNIHGPFAIKMIGIKVSPDVSINLKLVGTAEKGWEDYVLPSRKKTLSGKKHK